jgi:hypothetical protein
MAVVRPPSNRKEIDKKKKIVGKEEHRVDESDMQEICNRSVMSHDNGRRNRSVP